MALRNITELDLGQMAKLYSGKTFRIIVHPYYFTFFGQTVCPPSLEDVVDKKIESIFEILDNRVYKEDFLKYGEAWRGEVSARQQMCNTLIYLNAVVTFLEAYELIKEDTLLREDTGNPCLVILPGEYVEGQQYTREQYDDRHPKYMDHITEVCERNSHLFSASSLTYTGSTLSEQTLNAIVNFCKACELESVDLLGGYLHMYPESSCIRNLEKALKERMMTDINVLTDESVTKPVLLTQTILMYEPPNLIEGLHQEEYTEIVEIINGWLDNPTDFKELKQAIGKDIDTKLEIFRTYQDIISGFLKIKQKYTLYEI